MNKIYDYKELGQTLETPMTEEFANLINLCSKNQNNNYYDFPSTAYAFSHSFKNSKLEIINDCVFRTYGTTMTLINWFCNFETLCKTLKEINFSVYPSPKNNPVGYKIKCLNFIDKDVPSKFTLPNLTEFIVTKDYDFTLPHLVGKTGQTARRKLKVFNRDYFISSDATPEEIQTVYNEWITFAKERHFMVVKGHYQRYIDFYLDKTFNNVNILLYRNKVNVLWGIFGYEIINDQAQITLAKHRPGDNSFSFGFWYNSVKYILEKENINKIYAGSTADDLKETLGFTKVKSYKLDLDKILGDKL